MKHAQLALQLYTLRDFCGNASNFAATCKKVKEIGYETVELAGLGPISESEIVSILNGEGLVCCSSHEPADLIRRQPQAIVERLQKLGVAYTAYPFPEGVDWRSEVQIDALIHDLDAAGEVFRAAGQILAYHNHADEFIKVVGGNTILEEIYSRTDPQNLCAEIDTYWVQYGGGDPVEWCRRLMGRLPLIHLKDYGFGYDGRPFFAEIGAGTLDWQRILSAAEASGCRYYIVEQDTCPGDPFDSVKKSYDFLAGRFFAD